MDLALTGFNPSFDQTSSAQTAAQRQRQQQGAQQQAAAGRVERDVTEAGQSARAEAATRTPQNARIINGEVLSSETTRLNADEVNQRLMSRSSAGQQPRGQPDSRRISVDQALQTFQDNQAMLTEQDNPRQVSGIIDEYV